MGTEDIRDPEYAERLESAAPDEYLRRREFLQRTALTAGLAAGLATVLDADTLVAEAAKRQDRRSPLPSPRNIPIDTFVVLMMENRSFDHYLGWLPEADGRQAGLSYVDKTGKTHSTRRLDTRLPGLRASRPRPLAGRAVARSSTAASATASCAPATTTSSRSPTTRRATSASSRTRRKAFTTYDRFHCSLMGSTLPNREYMHAAQSYGLIDNDLPPQTAVPDGLPRHHDLRGAASKAGVSNRYFFNDVPVSALWGAAGPRPLGLDRRVLRALRRAARCRDVSFVDPNFAGSVGEGPGLSGDEHPHGDVRDRPGVHGRRRPRLHGVAAVQARRALHRLRRVGRVLRPRAPGRACPTTATAATSTRTSG